jgi:hypothetical protein
MTWIAGRTNREILRKKIPKQVKRKGEIIFTPFPLVPITIGI